MPDEQPPPGFWTFAVLVVAIFATWFLVFKFSETPEKVPKVPKVPTACFVYGGLVAPECKVPR